MNKRTKQVMIAFVFTAGLLAMGYLSFGFWTTFIFASGFLTGFLLWVFIPVSPSFESIRKPYWATLVAFILLHRVEEYYFGFQKELSLLTGNPVPALNSPALIILVLASVGGWLLIPYLVKRKNFFGYYLTWTFFAAMGITELAHFSSLFLQGSLTDIFPAWQVLLYSHRLPGGVLVALPKGKPSVV